MTATQTVLTWVQVGQGVCSNGQSTCRRTGPLYAAMESDGAAPPVCRVCLGEVEMIVAERRARKGATCAYCRRVDQLQSRPTPDFSGALVMVCPDHATRHTHVTCNCGSRQFVDAPAPLAVLGRAVISRGNVPTCAQCGKQPQAIAQEGGAAPSLTFAECPHTHYTVGVMGITCEYCFARYDRARGVWEPAQALQCPRCNSTDITDSPRRPPPGSPVVHTAPVPTCRGCGFQFTHSLRTH